jgi:curli production assembly/transport component CsgG
MRHLVKPLVSCIRVATLIGTLALAGCVQDSAKREPLEERPIVARPSPTAINLENLPPPARKVSIAVYQFPDLTGKNEPNENVAVFSRAVTQGGSGLIIDALKRAGNGNWFTVVERTGLNDLLQERQLIRATRQEYSQEIAKPLPPILFAGLLVQGGILTYDANTITGGVGANFLGIGGDVQYRRDVVTVGVRIVSVQSGEVLSSVTTTKTIYSAGVNANAYKFVSVDKLLQIEAGVTRNEPAQFAVRQAIDLAVYSAVIEGVRNGIWSFADPGVSQRLVQQYIERDKPSEAEATKVASASGSSPRL